MEGKNIDKLINNTIESLDGATRATPKPFLLTRILATVNKQETITNRWSAILAFISRPGFVIAALSFVLTINFIAFRMNKNDSGNTVVIQTNTAIADEFAGNINNIYEFENTDTP